MLVSCRKNVSFWLVSRVVHKFMSFALTEIIRSYIAWFATSCSLFINSPQTYCASNTPDAVENTTSTLFLLTYHSFDRLMLCDCKLLQNFLVPNFLIFLSQVVFNLLSLGKKVSLSRRRTSGISSRVCLHCFWLAWSLRICVAMSLIILASRSCSDVGFCPFNVTC